MTIILKYWYLDITDIGIIVINLYPIYRIQKEGTPRPSRIYKQICYIGETKDIDDYEFEF